MPTVNTMGLGQRTFSCQTVCLKLACICCLLLITAMAVASFIARPRIHSCEMYIPNKFSNSLAAIKSILMYANQQGWNALFGDIVSVVRSEILNLAPYPELSEKLANKHLLMIGGAKTSLALRRAKQLGISLTIVDEKRMELFVANQVMCGSPSPQLQLG